MVEAVTQATGLESALHGLTLDQAAIADVQARVQHLLTHPAELIARRQDLERRTTRTMSERERLEYRLLSVTREVVSFTPEGQQVREEFHQRDDAGRAPYAGLMVAYYPRSGEGRSNRPWFPSRVMKDRGRGVLELIVDYDASERLEVIAPRRSPDNMRGSWDYLENDPHWEIAELKARISSLEGKLEALTKNGRSK